MLTSLDATLLDVPCFRRNYDDDHYHDDDDDDDHDDDVDDHADDEMMMMMTSWDAGFHRGKLTYLNFS